MIPATGEAQPPNQSVLPLNVSNFVKESVMVESRPIILSKVLAAVTFPIALTISLSIASNAYLRDVILADEKPADLATVILVAVAIDTVLFSLLMVLMMGVFFMAKRGDRFNRGDQDRVQKFIMSRLSTIVTDFVIGSVVKIIALVPIATTVSSDEYYDYNGDGLRAISSLRAMLLPAGTILSMIPYGFIVDSYYRKESDAENKLKGVYKSLRAHYQEVALSGDRILTNLTSDIVRRFASIRNEINTNKARLEKTATSLRYQDLAIDLTEKLRKSVFAARPLTAVTADRFRDRKAVITANINDNLQLVKQLVNYAAYYPSTLENFDIKDEPIVGLTVEQMNFLKALNNEFVNISENHDLTGALQLFMWHAYGIRDESVALPKGKTATGSYVQGQYVLETMQSASLSLVKNEDDLNSKLNSIEKHVSTIIDLCTKTIISFRDTMKVAASAYEPAQSSTATPSKRKTTSPGVPDPAAATSGTPRGLAAAALAAAATSGPSSGPAAATSGPSRGPATPGPPSGTVVAATTATAASAAAAASTVGASVSVPEGGGSGVKGGAPPSDLDAPFAIDSIAAKLLPVDNALICSIGNKLYLLIPDLPANEFNSLVENTLTDISVQGKSALYLAIPLSIKPYTPLDAASTIGAMMHRANNPSGKALSGGSWFDTIVEDIRTFQLKFAKDTSAFVAETRSKMVSATSYSKLYSAIASKIGEFNDADIKADLYAIISRESALDPTRIDRQYIRVADVDDALGDSTTLVGVASSRPVVTESATPSAPAQNDAPLNNNNAPPGQAVDAAQGPQNNQGNNAAPGQAVNAAQGPRDNQGFRGRVQDFVRGRVGPQKRNA